MTDPWATFDWTRPGLVSDEALVRRTFRCYDLLGTDPTALTADDLMMLRSRTRHLLRRPDCDRHACGQALAKVEGLLRGAP